MTTTPYKQQTLDTVIEHLREFAAAEGNADKLPETIDGSTRLDAGGILGDSLAQIEFVLYLEEKFGEIDIPDEALEKVKTLGDLAAAIDAILG